MEADGFAFAIRVSRQVDRIHALGRRLQLRDELLLAFDDLIVRLEVLVDVHSQVLLRKILDVAERSLYDVLLAEIFADRFRLRRRFDDDERFCHDLFRE